MIKKPPMAFLGHKGKWGEYIQNAARALPQNAVVYDVFGGSGMCSRAVIEARPDVKVYWNDFDNYLEQLDRAPETEILRQELQKSLGPRGLRKSGIVDEPKINLAAKRDALDVIEAHIAKYGYVDRRYIMRWLYFSP